MDHFRFAVVANLLLLCAAFGEMGPVNRAVREGKTAASGLAAVISGIDAAKAAKDKKVETTKSTPAKTVTKPAPSKAVAKPVPAKTIKAKASAAKPKPVALVKAEAVGPVNKAVRDGKTAASGLAAVISGIDAAKAAKDKKVEPTMSTPAKTVGKPAPSKSVAKPVPAKTTTAKAAAPKPKPVALVKAEAVGPVNRAVREGKIAAGGLAAVISGIDAARAAKDKKVEPTKAVPTKTVEKPAPSKSAAKPVPAKTIKAKAAAAKPKPVALVKAKAVGPVNKAVREGKTAASGLAAVISGIDAAKAAKDKKVKPVSVKAAAKPVPTKAAATKPKPVALVKAKSVKEAPVTSVAASPTSSKKDHRLTHEELERTERAIARAGEDEVEADQLIKESKAELDSLKTQLH